MPRTDTKQDVSDNNPTGGDELESIVSDAEKQAIVISNLLDNAIAAEQMKAAFTAAPDLAASTALGFITCAYCEAEDVAPCCEVENDLCANCAQESGDHAVCESCGNHFDTDSEDWCGACQGCVGCTHSEDEDEDEEQEQDSSLSAELPWEARGLVVTRDETIAILYPNLSETERTGSNLEGSYKKSAKMWGVDVQADPVQAMADFYLLDGIVGMVFNGGTHVRQDPGCRQVAAEAQNAQEELVAFWDRQFCGYVDMVIGGELRHHRAFNRIAKFGRATAWAQWKVIRDRVGPDALEDAAGLFRKMPKPNSGGIGGEKWAIPADLLYARLTDRIDPKTWVDRVFTLQHNGGSLLNKLEWKVENMAQWSVTRISTFLGPAHAAEEVPFGVLLVAASPRVQSLFSAWWRASNRCRREWMEPVTVAPTWKTGATVSGTHYTWGFSQGGFLKEASAQIQQEAFAQYEASDFPPPKPTPKQVACLYLMQTGYTSQDWSQRRLDKPQLLQAWRELQKGGGVPMEKCLDSRLFLGHCLVLDVRMRYYGTKLPKISQAAWKSAIDHVRWVGFYILPEAAQELYNQEAQPDGS